ncbi:MAG TPA: BolA family protein [Reyranella sp.]|nr:BolA family protein [Reyranella sp.]
MTVRDAIVEKLSAKFTPTHLEVFDDSDRHRGHAGWREGGETHFRVRLSSPKLVGLTRLAQHRAVMEALDAEIKAGVHALAIEIIAPGAPTRLPDSI